MLPKMLLQGKLRDNEKEEFERRNKKKLKFYDIFRINRAPVMSVEDYDIRLVIFRHAERIDHSLGIHWYKQIFGNSPSPPAEAYSNPNLPHQLPRRLNGLLYEFDPPINRSGEHRSMKTGFKLAQCNVKIDYCYSSPASRSVLTASNILRGLNERSVPIRIEKKLFEPVNWNSPLQLLGSTDPFVSLKDWYDAGHHVDLNYHSITKSLPHYGTEFDYYDRSRWIFQHLTDRFDASQHPSHRQYQPQRKSITILIVGHGSSPCIFSSLALGVPFNLDSFIVESNKTPYLHCAVLDRNAQTKQWSVVDRLKAV